MNVPRYPVPSSPQGIGAAWTSIPRSSQPKLQAIIQDHVRGSSSCVGVQSRWNEPPSPPVKSGLTGRKGRPSAVAPTPAVCTRTPPRGPPQRAALLPAKTEHRATTTFAILTAPERTSPLAHSRRQPSSRPSCALPGERHGSARSSRRWSPPVGETRVARIGAHVVAPPHQSQGRRPRRRRVRVGRRPEVWRRNRERRPSRVLEWVGE
jgi:hypothetical protein